MLKLGEKGAIDLRRSLKANKDSVIKQISPLCLSGGQINIGNKNQKSTHPSGQGQ